jgi:ribosome modulation factor
VTSKRRLREQLYIAEAERNAWYEAWREAVQNQCVCRVDNAPTE